MNHEYYRSRFNQYPPLPDDRVVYGPHPSHCNWYKRQWDASQMLPDQNAKHRPYPRWTNTNLIGDLGDWGRWREAKRLLRVNQRAAKQGKPEPYPGITPMVVHGAKETAREAI